MPNLRLLGWPPGRAALKTSLRLLRNRSMRKLLHEEQTHFPFHSGLKARVQHEYCRHSRCHQEREYW